MSTQNAKKQSSDRKAALTKSNPEQVSISKKSAKAMRDTFLTSYIETHLIRIKRDDYKSSQEFIEAALAGLWGAEDEKDLVQHVKLYAELSAALGEKVPDVTEVRERLQPQSYKVRAA